MLGPNRYVSRLHEVSLAELEQIGIRGLIVDLDNTMIGFEQTEIAQEHLDWVREAHERGFKIAMVSNNFNERVTNIAGQLNIFAVPNALKPLPFGFLRGIRMLQLSRKQIAVVGDQLFTDVLGAKLCGLYTILTEPIQTKDFPLTRLFRFFERLVLPGRKSSS